MFIVKFRRIHKPKYNNSIKIGKQSSPNLFKITSFEVPTPSMGTEYEILEKTREKAPCISNINLFGFLQSSHPHTTHYINFRAFCTADIIYECHA
jgi:hypothetical protein